MPRDKNPPGRPLSGKNSDAIRGGKLPRGVQWRDNRPTKANITSRSAYRQMRKQRAKGVQGNGMGSRHEAGVKISGNGCVLAALALLSLPAGLVLGVAAWIYGGWA